MSGVKTGSNIGSLTVQRNLAQSGLAVSKAFERLASGQRINGAGDDAAGLAVSSVLRSQVKVKAQALRNVNDGVSATNIVQGALTELRDIATRQQELAEQAANGVYSTVQRQAMSREANSLVDEFNRIVTSVEFNGRKLLDRSNGEMRIQAGYGVDGSIKFEIGAELDRTAGTASFYAGNGAAEVTQLTFGSGSQINDASYFILRTPDMAFYVWFDKDGAGNDPIGSGVNSLPIYFEAGYSASQIRDSVTAALNESGFFTATASDSAGVSVQNWATGAVTDAANVDVGAALTIQVTTQGVTGSVAAKYTLGGSPFDLADMNGDGNLDILSSGADYVAINTGNGTGAFGAATFITSPAFYDSHVTYGDVNNDSRLDFVSSNGSVLLGSAGGTFTELDSGITLNGDRSPTVGDINNDGKADLISFAFNELLVFMGNGDGTFQRPSTYSSAPVTWKGYLADFNNDAKLDLMTWSLTGDMLLRLGNGDGSFGGALDPNANDAISARSLADFNMDGNLDFVGNGAAGAYLYSGRGDGTFARSAAFCVNGTTALAADDFNGDGKIDLASRDIGNKLFVSLGNGDGTFTAGSSTPVGLFASSFQLYSGDINSDGAADLLAGTSGPISIRLAQTAQISTIASVNLCTREGALAALESATEVLNRVSTELGVLGANMSRLDVAAYVLRSESENSLAASSRITDADMAVEAAALTKAQIIQQVASAVLGQANQAPSIALALLKQSG